MTKNLSTNALILSPIVTVHPGKPVNFYAKWLGWGWHRTNNALVELGYR